MHRRYGVLILLSVLTAAATVYSCVMGFYPYGLPLTLQVIGGHTGLIEPLPGIALPDGLRGGQRLDLSAQPLATRIAIIQRLNPTAPDSTPGRSYAFLVGQGATQRTVVVTSKELEKATGAQATAWISVWLSLINGIITLLALWRGRDRAAAGLALFTLATLLTYAIENVPVAGPAGLLQALGLSMLFLTLGGAGFYIMAASLAVPALGLRMERRWRLGMISAVAANLVVVCSSLVYVTAGWAEELRPVYGQIVTVVFLLPIAMLSMAYRRAETQVRQRLSWMLWAMGIWVAGVGALNLELGGQWGWLIPIFLQTVGMTGLLYVVLRHRVVDITIVLNRTLVYAATTALVLGVFALFESLIERVALGHRASLVFELAVPLGLGVSLSTVHRRIDTLVDRLIFRRQYREETALRRFASESAFVTQEDTLLDLAVDQILLHVGAPWVAIFEYGPRGYRRVRQRGTHDLPAEVAIDDLTVVKLRAHGSNIDLHDTQSGLGREGYAFPLRLRDHLLAVLVVGPRPGEHYAADERELIGHVAQSVGASLFALRARASETLLSESRARESALLDALRALGADSRVSTEP